MIVYMHLDYLETFTCRVPVRDPTQRAHKPLAKYDYVITAFAATIDFAPKSYL